MGIDETVIAEWWKRLPIPVHPEWRPAAMAWDEPRVVRTLTVGPVSFASRWRWQSERCGALIACEGADGRPRVCGMVVRDQQRMYGQSGCVVIGGFAAVATREGWGRETIVTERRRFEVRPRGFGVLWHPRHEYVARGSVVLGSRVPMMFESQSPSLWQFDAERREEGTLELFPRKTPMWDGGDRWSLLGCITPTERDVPCAPQAIGQQWVRVLRLGRPLLSGRLAEAMGRWDEQTREAVVLAAVWERMRYESLD